MAAEFSKAFPNLQVLTNAPAFYTKQLAVNVYDPVDSADVLQHCTSLRAIKALGTFAGCSLQQLQQLTQLTRLSLHNLWEKGGRVASEGIGQLTQLQHVRLTCSARAVGDEAEGYDEMEVETLNLSSQRAQQLAALPKLQTLALPAELLIKSWHRANLLEVASSSRLTRIEFLETWHKAELFWGLDRYWDALGDGVAQFRAAVDAAYEKHKAQQQHVQAQQQGQQQVQAQPSGRKLHITEHRGRQRHNFYHDEKNWLSELGPGQSCDGSQGVWGIYGTAGEW